MARYMDVSSTLSASSAVWAIANAAVVRRRCHFVILRHQRHRIGLSPKPQLGLSACNMHFVRDMVELPHTKAAAV